METVELAFEVFGDKQNPPLVILHGFFASARNWRQIAEKLAGDNCVYVPDLRNHGASPHHPVMDYPSMSSDLLQFINDHKLSPVNLLGHSMGGKVAMWFALNNPGQVAKLLIADIAPITYKHSFNNIINSLKSLSLNDLRNRKQAEEALAEAIPEHGYRQFLLQNLVLVDGVYQWRIDLSIFQDTADNIVAFPAEEDAVPYTGDAYVILGADSNYAQAENFYALFPTAKLIKIPNAAHWLHVQQPQAFLQQVRNILKIG